MNKFVTCYSNLYLCAKGQCSRLALVVSKDMKIDLFFVCSLTLWCFLQVVNIGDQMW